MGRSSASATTIRNGVKRNAPAPAASQEPMNDSAATARYIADMTSELAKMAGGAQMPLLSYFLNLARVEAEIRAREGGEATIERVK